jgi:hypothetical protein
MTKPARPSTSILCRRLQGTTFALVLFCVLIMVARQSAQAQTFQVIHNFTGGFDGGSPFSGVTLDRAGNLEGTASAGGHYNDSGAVYKLIRTGSAWTVNPLYEFAGGDDEAMPRARVVFGPDGNLCGTTFAGGSDNNCGEFTGCGTVFQRQPFQNATFECLQRLTSRRALT